MVKTAAILLLCMSAISCAEDQQKTEKKRLESVTWDLKTHKLSWVVQSGSDASGEFVPTSEAHYEISPDDAVMEASHERRGFTNDEAAALHRLLDTLALYCAESVVWWDNGQGKKLDGPKNDSEKLKIDEKADPPKRKENKRVPPSALIAALRQVAESSDVR